METASDTEYKLNGLIPELKFYNKIKKQNQIKILRGIKLILTYFLNVFSVKAKNVFNLYKLADVLFL